MLRFFEDETEGVKIKPEIVLVASMGLVVTSIVINHAIPSSRVVDQQLPRWLSSPYYSGRFICMVLQLNS